MRVEKYEELKKKKYKTSYNKINIVLKQNKRDIALIIIEIFYINNQYRINLKKEIKQVA